MILDNYKNFLDLLLQRIQEKGIDISKYNLDHIAYQAESNENYDRLKPQFLEIGKEISGEAQMSLTFCRSRNERLK